VATAKKVATERIVWAAAGFTPRSPSMPNALQKAPYTRRAALPSHCGPAGREPEGSQPEAPAGRTLIRW
jgi:hypothetical protein